MRSDSVEIANFRRLRSTRAGFAKEKTVFVGANYGGKTSAIVALPRPAPDWQSILPALDVWLHVESNEVHYVQKILLSLGWQGGQDSSLGRTRPALLRDLQPHKKEPRFARVLLCPTSIRNQMIANGWFDAHEIVLALPGHEQTN
jgi:hypothetical protein